MVVAGNEEAGKFSENSQEENFIRLDLAHQFLENTCCQITK